MIFNLDKYRRKFASVVLVSYLFLVSLTIFHYHHVNIQNGNYRLENNCGATGSNPLDKRDDLTHECTIQQFANTILNYSFTTVFNIIENTGKQDFSLNEILPPTSLPHYNSNPHRAPPLSV